MCGNTFIFKEQNYVCEDCLNKIYKTDFVYCHSCGKLTSHCQNCSVEKKFDDIGVFTRVSEDIKKIIGIYKLKSVKALSKDIADIINDDIKDFVIRNKIDLVTYVPLHRNVERKRGFNHLKEILINIFPKFAIKEVLIKVKDTRLQMDLSREERAVNLKGAFRLKETVDIVDKNLLLFDDIMTTGSTVIECYKELKRGKPKKIFCYVIAR